MRYVKSYLGHGDDFDLDVIRVHLSFLISSVLFYDLKASLSNYATARPIVLSTTTLNNHKQGHTHSEQDVLTYIPIAGHVIL